MRYPIINHGWRTPTVVALCRAMREARDYSAAPILADALQEAGAPEDDYVTDALRTLPQTERTELERLTALVLLPEAVDALTRLDMFVQECGVGGYPSHDDPEMTYDLLMTAARKFLDTGEDGFGDGHMNWSNASCGYPNDGTVAWPMVKFWQDFHLITGRAPSEDGDSGEFLSCSC